MPGARRWSVAIPGWPAQLAIEQRVIEDDGSLVSENVQGFQQLIANGVFTTAAQGQQARYAVATLQRQHDKAMQVPGEPSAR